QECVGVERGAVAELHALAQLQGPDRVVVVAGQRLSQLRLEGLGLEVVAHQGVVDGGKRATAGGPVGVGLGGVQRPRLTEVGDGQCAALDCRCVVGSVDVDQSG